MQKKSTLRGHYLRTGVLMLVLSIAVPGMAAGKAKTKITLDKKGTVTLNLGETLKITATVTPAATVTWKSNKKSVAEVDLLTTLDIPLITVTNSSSLLSGIRIVIVECLFS